MEIERMVLYKVNLSYSSADDNLYLQMTTEMERLMKIVLSPRLVSIAPPIHTPTPVCFFLKSISHWLNAASNFCQTGVCIE